MNKYSIAILCGFSFAAMLAVAQQEEGSAIFDGGWRLSAGGVYDSGVKTKMHFSPRMTPVPVGRSKEAAKAAGWGEADGDNIKYVNYNKGEAESTLSPNLVYPQGSGSLLDDTYTIPRAVWISALDEFELGYAEYDNEGGYLTDDRDEAAMFGINVELSRNLYHNEDDGWGIDMGFAVQYGRRNKAYRSSSTWGGGGYYRTSYRPSEGELLDDEALEDFYWGDPSSVSNIEVDEATLINSEGPIDGNSHAFKAEGDYEDLELMLLAHPYYDVYDWLRINGTLGVVVSRQEMDMTFTMMNNGVVDYHSHRDFSQWDVYGVGGLGLMFYYKDFTLSADFFARFLDDDMDISDRYYKGSVQRGHWMFKLSAGYEF